jgi:hypothetical protein
LASSTTRIRFTQELEVRRPRRSRLTSSVATRIASSSSRSEPAALSSSTRRVSRVEYSYADWRDIPRLSPIWSQVAP